MKRLAVFFLVLVLMSGCSQTDSGMNRAMSLREQILSSESCNFCAEVTADFGQTVYTFRMFCEADSEGTLIFRVEEPETISGITGRVGASGCALTFDDQALAFSPLADGELSPVIAPWLFLKALRGGYLSSCAEEDGFLRLTIDDSYESNAMMADIWLDEYDNPVHSDIYWQGRRILTVTIENFQIL